MDTIKNALTRKFGPLPAWAWLLGFGIVFYWYEHRSTSATASTATTSTDTTGNADEGLQVLEPGESVYDPGTGELTTAPGGGGSSDGTGTSGAVGNTPGTTASPLPAINIGPIKLTLPSTKGKPKAGSTGKGKPVKPKKPTKSAGRSNTTVKKQGRSLTLKQRIARGTAFGPTGTKRVAKPAATVGHIARQRPLTPATTTTVRQRPVASAMPKNRTQAAVSNPPRPSAPAARTANRTVQTKKVTPAAKKRTK